MWDNVSVCPWEVHLKRVQCLYVKVIDILPVSPLCLLSFLFFLTLPLNLCHFFLHSVFSFYLLFFILPLFTFWIFLLFLSLNLLHFHLPISVSVFRRSSSRSSSGSGSPCGNDYPAFTPSSTPATPTCREDRGHWGLQTTLLPVSKALTWRKILQSQKRSRKLHTWPMHYSCIVEIVSKTEYLTHSQYQLTTRIPGILQLIWIWSEQGTPLFLTLRTTSKKMSSKNRRTFFTQFLFNLGHFIQVI